MSKIHRINKKPNIKISQKVVNALNAEALERTKQEEIARKAEQARAREVARLMNERARQEEIVRKEEQARAREVARLMNERKRREEHELWKIELAEKDKRDAQIMLEIQESKRQKEKDMRRKYNESKKKQLELMEEET